MSKSPSYFINMASMVVQSIGIRALGFVSSLLLAHTLGPSGLGSYSIANSTAASIGQLSRGGIDVGVQSLTARRDPASEAEMISDILGSALTLFLLIAVFDALACLLLSPTIALRMFGNANVTPFIAMAAPLVVLQLFAQYAYSAFAGLHRFTHYSRAVMITAPFPPALAILGGLTGDAFYAVLGYIAGQGIVTTVTFFTLARLCRGFNVRLMPRASINQILSVLRIGLPFFAAVLLTTPAHYYAESLLVFTHGTQELGNLRIVLAISTIVSLIPSAINGPMISRFVRSESDEADSHNRFVLFNIKILLVFGLLVIAVGAPWWGVAVNILFGAKYALAAATGFVALLTAVLVIVINVVANNLLAKRRLGLLFSTNATYAATFAVLSFLVIPKLGLEGYLLAQFSAYSLVLVIITASFLIRNRRRDEAVPVIAMVLVTVAIGAAVFALYDEGVQANVLWQLALSFLSIGLIAWTGWQFIFTGGEIDVIAQRILGIVSWVRRD